MCLGIPGKIVNVYKTGNIRMCKVEFDGVFREVCLETIPDASIGDYIIVHAGFALALIDESEAKLTLDTLKQLANFDNENQEPEQDQGKVS